MCSITKNVNSNFYIFARSTYIISEFRNFSFAQTVKGLNSKKRQKFDLKTFKKLKAYTKNY